MSDVRSGELDACSGDCPRTGMVRRRKRPRLIITLIVLLAAVDGGVYYMLAGRDTQSSNDATIAADQIIVRAPILGQIASFSKEEAAMVAKGDVLATLDDTTLKAEEREAVADNELANANVAVAQATVDQAANDLLNAKALLQSKVIPQKQYDGFVIAKAAAESQLKIATILARLTKDRVAEVSAGLQSTV